MHTSRTFTTGMPTAEVLQRPTVRVLASGRGDRFTPSGGSGDKLQADLHGKSVLERTLSDLLHLREMPEQAQLRATDRA